MAEAMAAAALRYDRYATGGGSEWMLLHGPATGPQALILAPFFAEANATRALLADVARRLAQAGIGSAIPDLPGTGESLHPIERIGWNDWRDGARDAAASLAGSSGAVPHLIALRGGVLLDHACVGRSRWRLAPAPGAALIRPMERAQAIGERETGRTAPRAGGVVELAGYRLGPALLDPLRAAEPAAAPGPIRALPFDGPGLAPWRRAEPGHDRAFGAALADDIIAWIASCGR